jgi:hypothetical protein
LRLSGFEEVLEERSVIDDGLPEILGAGYCGWSFQSREWSHEPTLGC